MEIPGMGLEEWVGIYWVTERQFKQDIRECVNAPSCETKME